MTTILVGEISDSLKELAKIEKKIKRMNSTRDLLKGYIEHVEKKDIKPIEKEENPKEPSKEDFKQTCDSLLNQLKEERIQNDELTEEIKALRHELNMAEDNNRILLTTIDILNNKIEDIEEYLYLQEANIDDENNEYEEDNEEEETKKE